MIDIRNKLMRSPTVPETYRQSTGYATIHWNGPSVLPVWNKGGDLGVLQADAKYHVEYHNWDGLAYHYAIGRTGQQYQCRLYNTRLPHSGNTKMNNESFSVLVLTGDGDPITDAMYAALHERLVLIGIERRFWLGHQEAPRTTACPGAALMRWLGARRNEVRQQVSGVRVLYNGHIRDNPDKLSLSLGGVEPGQTLAGWWRLGKPVQGDSLWFELSGDRYVHASALNASSYRKVF